MLNIIKSNKKYLIFGLSIVFSRGLEYFVLFFAALYLSKSDYGELEFYKKVIELGAVVLAFGLPSLLLTYTKSTASKINLTFLSFLFILFFGLVLAPILYSFDYELLLIPILFHAIFFNNGIIPVFFITKSGSNTAALYKSIISVVFYSGVFLLVLYSDKPYLAFVNVNYIIFPLSIIYIIKLLIQNNIQYKTVIKYYRLFKKLLLSSLTLVVSNFANIMFLYTDIMLIKLISANSNIDIADYSFALNFGNMLILIPLTLVQVDIESIKTMKNINKFNLRILKYVFIFSLVTAIGYVTLVNTIYLNFQETVYLFAVILAAKFFQAQSVLFGAVVLIKRKYKINLTINIFALGFNLLLSFLFFKLLGVVGVALASFISLLVRYLLLRYYSNHYALNK